MLSTLILRQMYSYLCLYKNKNYWITVGSSLDTFRGPHTVNATIMSHNTKG